MFSADEKTNITQKMSCERIIQKMIKLKQFKFNRLKKILIFILSKKKLPTFLQI